jgi:DNA invertase Pin-like site-specific DNA recombinase
MANVGYARASTVDQDLSIQIAALKAAGCDPIRSEKRSGTTVAGRDELRTVLDFLREGDTLTITRIDRLAVEPQEVVLGQIETADGRFGSDTAMGPMPIVAMEPSGQFGCAFV